MRLGKASTQIALGITGLVSLALAQELLLCRPNRRAIELSMGQLRVGMSSAEVEHVLSLCGAGRLSRDRWSNDEGNGVRLSGQAGLAGWWEMAVGYHEGRLKWARVWTEDGPYHPRSVPPDIGVLPGRKHQ